MTIVVIVFVIELMTKVLTTDVIAVVDSWGKSKDGYFFGNGANLGMYDECVTTSSTIKDFKGKFCSLQAW